MYWERGNKVRMKNDRELIGQQIDTDITSDDARGQSEEKKQ